MLRALSATLLLAPILAPGPTAGDDGVLATTAFVEAVDVDVVSLEVHVTDRQGDPVEGLTAKDFVVQEDGRKVQLTHFAAIERRGRQESSDPLLTGDAPPLFVVFFLDEYTIDSGQRRRALEELRGYIHRARDSPVAYAVASYDGTLEIDQPFTLDRDLILAALRDAAEPGPLGLIRQRQREAVTRESLRMLSNIQQLVNSPIRDTEVPRYLAEITRQIDQHASDVRALNQASLYALSHLTNSLAALPGRKSVIYVSDGLPARPGQALYEAISSTFRAAQQDDVDQGNVEAVDADIRARSGALSALESGRGRRSTTARQGPSEELQTLTALANTSGVSFYAYKAQGNVGGVEPEFGGAGFELLTPQFKSVREENLSETLRVLAGETGGRAFVGGDLQELIRQAEADAASYYSLGYAPRHGGDGGFHAIKVKVKGRRRGLQVRHRRGYVDKPLTVRAADRTSTSLLLGIDDNPLGLTLDVGAGREDSATKSWIVPVRLGVPLEAVTLTRDGSIYWLEARVYIASRSATGELAPVQEGTLRIEVEAEGFDEARSQTHTSELQLSLSPGAQRVALGFLDPVQAVTSFVSRDIEVGTD